MPFRCRPVPILPFALLLALAPPAQAADGPERKLSNWSNNSYDLSIFKGIMEDTKVAGTGSLTVSWLDARGQSAKKELKTNGDHVTIAPKTDYVLTFTRESAMVGVHLKVCLRLSDIAYRSFNATSYVLPTKPAIELVEDRSADWSSSWNAINLTLDNTVKSAAATMLKIQDVGVRSDN